MDPKSDGAARDWVARCLTAWRAYCTLTSRTLTHPPSCSQVDPKSDGAARDWVAIYDECSRILYQEIDYRLEGANADRFR